MESTSFTTIEVFSAYKKLKHYFYYDNTSLFIRKKIADFEEKVESETSESLTYDQLFWNEMTSIANRINTKSLGYWQKYFDKSIGYRITPKSFEKISSPILTNRSKEDNLQIQRVNIFIDAEIEVHIIAVLWLMYAGVHLSKWVDKDNYAYQLELSDETQDVDLVGGLRLYKPYFIQYQNWRDKAIKKAEQLFEEKKDIVILSLDIRDYFHSVKIDLLDVKKRLFVEKNDLAANAEINKIFILLHSINTTYTKKIKSVKGLPVLKSSESILPIGLLSSGLLGNIYLREFDKVVKEKLNPSYYGRYVDDILLVLTNVEVKQNSLSPVNYFLEKYFINREILSFENTKEIPKGFLQKRKNYRKGETSEFIYLEPDITKLNEKKYVVKLLEAQSIKFILKAYPSLLIQSRKVILQDLDWKESPAILNNFKKNLEKNRSEFRFLPDEDEVEKEFDQEAFALHYNDSLNKIRSIKELSEDKYGASKYLAGKIFATSLSDEKPDAKTNTQLLTFFKGLIGFNFHTLWEKVATYFIINEQSDSLVRFYTQCKKAINNIEFEKYEDSKYKKAIKDQLAQDMIEYLTIAIATPLSCNPSLKIKTLFHKKDFQVILTYARSIRAANMFRHAWVGLPGINFTEYLFTNDLNNNLYKVAPENFSANVIEGENLADEKKNELSGLAINKRLQLLSPRYVHFHEMNILEIYKVVYSIKDMSESEITKFDRIPTDAFKIYWETNHLWKHLPEEAEVDYEGKISENRKLYFEIDDDNAVPENREFKLKANIISINSLGNELDADKKIGIANIKVHANNIKRSYLGNPNTSRDRRQELFKLINLVEEAKCDLFVLPEVSVPHQWINLLAYQSCRRNIGIIAGLEHWVNKSNFAFNFMATVLPIQRDKYNSCLIKIRLKNHYSPEEKKQLNGYRLLIPGETVFDKPKKYDLFHWKKSFFSVYNCFELADITDRSLFKSRVDFIIASEYNKDTSYFSEIAGSWVRDIHCFFIQVNSSDYGDSRVIQPSSSTTRNILQIKGGENSTIVVGILPIKSLRQFQLKEYSLQKDDDSFKPTPPNFNRASVVKRINNEKKV